MAKIQKALNKAYELHKPYNRKGGDIPYLVHILDVAKYLMYETKDQDIICAGLLHDTIEDTPYQRSELLNDFGQRIFDLVIFCTENGNNTSLTKEEAIRTWKKRKEESISKLDNASHDECLVFLADKTANLLSICEDMEFGVDIWPYFNASKSEVEWYYRSILEKLRNKLGETRLFKVFESLFGVFE